jgi:hypothetical protein
LVYQNPLVVVEAVVEAVVARVVPEAFCSF